MVVKNKNPRQNERPFRTEGEAESACGALRRLRRCNTVLLMAMALLLCNVTMACSADAKKYGDLGLPGDQVPMMEEVRQGVLPNGLRYYILANSKPENRAYLTLAVNAGSVLETEAERGLAHFVEHMAFEGTEHFQKSELDDYLRSLGMRFGADFNAHTGYDQTVYGIVVPTEQSGAGVKTIPEKALSIIDDWTHTVLFKQEDVDAERAIIMEEYRARLGVNERMRRMLLPKLFAQSQYVDRLPIGLPEVIENAPPTLLKSFYDRWYRADNMAIIFVGDFDADALEESLLSYFTMPKPDTALDIPVYDMPSPRANTIETAIFTDPEQTATHIGLYYKRQFSPITDTLEIFRNDLIDALIDIILSERFDELEENIDTPYFNVGAGNIRYVKRSFHYYLGATVQSGLLEKSLEELLGQKESIVRFGFLNSEIERAKRKLLSSMERNAAEKEKIESESYIYSFTNNFLWGENVAGADWNLNATQTLLPLMSADDIHTAVKNYFSGGELLVFVSANNNDADTLPSEEQIISIVKASAKAKIEKPKEVAIESELLKIAPEKGSIAGEYFDAASETHAWQLSNGATVLLKITENKNDQILLSALARGGKTNVPTTDIPSATLVSEIVNASGFGDWNLSDLNKIIAGKEVSVSFNISSWTRSVDGSSTVADLKTFFELLHLVYTAPRLDNNIAEIVKEQYRTILTQRRENPENYFNDELSKILHGNNPYFVPFEVKDIDLFNIETARRFVQKSLNPADYTFVFTGNIDLDTIRPLIETYLASIPQKEAFNQWSDVKIKFPQKLDKEIFKGKENKSIVFLGHLLEKNYRLQDSITAEVLGEYLDILLVDVARQKLGGVYSISPSVSHSPLPLDGMLESVVYFICDPKRVDELTIAVENEFAKIAGGNINATMFTNAKSALVKSYETSLQSNSYICGRLANYAVIFNLPLAELYKKADYYNSVQVQDISAMARTLLGSALVRAVLYPLGGK
ncbi:MAG: insulinase family protein [Spirochaetaceae bacterium]|jgi:zinc protease|nr:insulinase family protein [Spirochaetaceae bacterium]